MVKEPSILAPGSPHPLTGADAARLQASSHGPDHGMPVLLAHGFGQTRSAWESTATALAEAGFRAIAYDARGHGESDWNDKDTPYSGEQFTDDLIVVAGEMSEPPVLVAASMGGLFGLLGEARWPGLFRAMVLVDITPRWDTSGVERILAFMTAHPDGFASLQAAADAISAYLPHRARKSEDGLRRLLRPDASGRWHWHWDPRLIAELAGGDAARQQAVMVEAARQVRCPVLLISGGRSDLVTPQTISEFMSLVPHAQHVQLPEATHMVASDDNTAFTAAVLHYLDSLPPANAATSLATEHAIEHVTGAKS